MPIDAAVTEGIPHGSGTTLHETRQQNSRQDRTTIVSAKSALCDRRVPLSPSRAAPRIKEEPAVSQITYERSNDPVKHKVHETPCNNQIGANTIGIESPRA